MCGAESFTAVLCRSRLFYGAGFFIVDCENRARFRAFPGVSRPQGHARLAVDSSDQSFTLNGIPARVLRAAWLLARE